LKLIDKQPTMAESMEEAELQTETLIEPPLGEYVGEVKWYSTEKQFGFIIVEGYSKEIFVHETQLTGVGLLHSGQRVKFKFQEEKGKKKAFDVATEEGEPLPKLHGTLANQSFKKRLDATPGLFLGTIKWFAEDKGFGFIIPQDKGADVFFHQRVIKRSMNASLLDGQDVEYKLEEANEDEKAKASEVTQPGGLPFSAQGSLPGAPLFGAHSGFQPPMRAQSEFGGLLQPPQPPRGPLPPQHFMPYQPPPNAGRTQFTGTIKFFKADKGYGFVVPAEGGEEIFVHSSGVVGYSNGEEIKKGTAVTYNVSLIKGQKRAQDCVALDGTNLTGGSSKSQDWGAGQQGNYAAALGNYGPHGYPSSFGRSPVPGHGVPVPSYPTYEDSHGGEYDAYSSDYGPRAGPHYGSAYSQHSALLGKRPAPSGGYDLGPQHKHYFRNGGSM
jgi:CspA family cold shock protein